MNTPFLYRKLLISCGIGTLSVQPVTGAG
jgi:hypothetical protein